MYKLYFDDYPLYDPRDDSLLIREPNIHLAVGEAGAVSFTIDQNHPYSDKLTPMKGAVKLLSDSRVIFRGRIRKDTRCFDRSREIEAEGLLACLNDSYIPPFSFPDDFAADPEYIAAAENGNVVEFFLGWLLQQHNSQVGAFQKIQIGSVTVTDPNNYIYLSSSGYLSTMEVLRKKLEDPLGGYLVVDYSGETTILNYYAELPLTNTQEVEFGKNLLDVVSEFDSTETYTAILPIGKDGLTITGLPDEEIWPGVWKQGPIIYSREAEKSIGGRITKMVEWKDVTLNTNLRAKAANLLSSEGIKTEHTLTVTALDLGAVEDVSRFVVGRMVRLNSAPHGISMTYPLMELEPDIFNPANTEITLGGKTKTASGMAHQGQLSTQEKIDQTKMELQQSVSEVEKNLSNRIDGIDGTYFYIKYSQYDDGHVMTDAPDDNTQYMGTCSTSQETAPTDYKAYTWCKVRGNDGKNGENGTPGQPGEDGRTQYLHIKYSDDGKTFTGNLLSTNISDWESGWYRNSHEANAARISHPEKIKVTPDKTYRYNVGNTNYKIGFTAYSGEDDSSYIVANQYSSSGSITMKSTWNYIRIYIVPMDTAGITFDTYKELFATGELTPVLYPDGTAGEELGAYIGTLVDFDATDSNNFNDYKWSKFTEDVDAELEDIRHVVEERHTSAINTAESIILSALESYVETSNYEEFRQTVESQFSVLADEINMNFTTTTEQIENVDGDLQSKFNELHKWIKFSGETAITIGSDQSSITLELDNEKGILFKKNGVTFGYWDGENFHTGNIVIDVNERAQFGNFAFVPRSDGSLSFLKVGG